MSTQRRSTRSNLVHISVAIDEALDWLQARVERSAARHGDLAGPILPEQRRASSAIDVTEKLFAPEGDWTFLGDGMQ